MQYGEKIPVSTAINVNVRNYEKFFKYIVYDGYRPNTLA